MDTLADPTSVEMLENRTFDEIAVGDQASIARKITEQDIALFAVATGDVNPAHMDPVYAKNDMFHHVIAHGMLSAGLISSVLGTKLPGPGTIYLSQDLHFLHPVSIGDTVTAILTVTQKRLEKGDVVLECRCINQHEKVVVSGTALVRAPKEKVRIPKIELPDVQLSRHQRFQALLHEARYCEPVATVVAAPCEIHALAAVVEAAAAGLMTPILVGPAAAIAEAARSGGIDISTYRVMDVPMERAAAEAVAMISRGQASLLMKGALHTDDLLRAVLAADGGLSTGRRLSHVYLMDVPGHSKPLLITDAAVNVAPDLDQKREIVQNAIDLAHVMGIQVPRVALLSAIETVNPKMRSTLDAAALCKMADRGQIKGGLLDGPLAFDNAISPDAAREKGIVSDVAGHADILVVPDLESGNMLAKQLTFLSGADAAGIVLGAKVPIVLTSRADSGRTRLASCAVAVLLARRWPLASSGGG